MLRRTVLALAVAAFALALSAPAAPAATSWCSESGDQCWGTFKRDGKRYVGVTYAAKYKTSEKLCVKAPSGQRDCITRKRETQPITNVSSVAPHSARMRARPAAS